jgi:hypothetical protein
MRTLFGCLGLLGLLASVWAQGVSQPFTYQGYLRQGGAPLNNPSQSMRFRIYDALTGGTALWDSGALTVNVSNGLFTVQLNPPVSIWTGADRFLEIQVGTTTLTPRVRLGATPYANTATLLNMFQTGTTNPDRMVITHSPAFSNWGLQYRDTDDSFHFLGFGTTQVRIGLFDGLVGIGTTTPVAPLTFANATGDKIVFFSTATNAQYGIGLQSRLLQIFADEAASDIAFGFGTSASFTERMRIKGNGNVGIGTTAPAAKLDVNGNTILRGNISFDDDIRSIIFPPTTAPNEPMVYMFSSGTSNSDRMVIAHSPSFSDWGFQYRDSDDSIHFLRAGATQVRIGLVDGNVGIGTASPAAKLDVNGTARVRVLEIVGADLAEKFPTTETLEPGTVVEIDPDNPGHLRKAQGAYNKRVAGVVAGANGLSEGIILGNLEGSENHTPIAMSGRVWVYADATHEAIEPGDLLTTSDKPGYAMKASNLNRANGALMGKSMTRLEKGKTGMVLVLVNLQ